jgi:hypothetical protein
MLKIKGLHGQINNDDIDKGVNSLLGKEDVSIHVIFLCKVWKREKHVIASKSHWKSFLFGIYVCKNVNPVIGKDDANTLFGCRHVI